MANLFHATSAATLALFLAAIILFVALFVSGRPSDAGAGIKWQWWLGVTAVVVLVVFVLSTGVSNLPNMDLDAEMPTE